MSGTRSGVPDQPASPAVLMVRLWPQPDSCADARRAVRAFCVDQAVTPLADDAELLTSELVTNAIAHCATLITLLATFSDDRLVVVVRDDERAERALIAATAETMAESGRGLHLVASIAGAWGTTSHPDGKSVWFRLP